MADEHKLARTVKLRLNGQEYTCDKFTLGQIPEFSATMKQRRRERMAAALQGRIGPSEWLALAKDIEAHDEQGELATMEGLALAFSIGMRRHHPEMTEQIILDSITLEDLEQVAKAFLGSAMPSDEDHPKNAEAAETLAG